LASAQPTLPIVKKIVKKSESLKKVELDIAKTMESGLKIEAFIYDKLRPHQVEGVNFMYECITGQRGKAIEGCILADFMGLGKTLQTLTLIRCAVIQKIAQKIVVVSPLTLVKVWEK
jgi:SNF2 family DNA or RNA helicase